MPMIMGVLGRGGSQVIRVCSVSRLARTIHTFTKYDANPKPMLRSYCGLRKSDHFRGYDTDNPITSITMNHLVGSQRTLIGHIAMLILIACLASCSTKRFCQVLSTASVDAVDLNGSPVFENEEMRITYEFWAKGGQMTFTIQNKLSVPIHIDWNRSHLIHNGASFEYWTDSEETTSVHGSSSSGVMVSTLSTSGGQGSASGSVASRLNSSRSGVTSTVRNRPKPVLHIPPGGAVTFSRFQLLTSGIYDCDFFWKTPKISDRQQRVYERDNSPLIFRNYLTYSTDPAFAETKVVDNEFYLRSATFLSSSSFLGPRTIERQCPVNGLAVPVTQYARPYKKGNSFYFRFGR